MATELDRLFREKLDQLEVKPTAQAWESVRMQITSQKTSWWTPMRIAASVILVLAGGLSLYLLPKTQPAQSEMAVLADHPVAAPALVWEWHIPVRREAAPAKKHTKPAIPVAKPVIVPEKITQERNWQLVTVAPIAPKLLEVESLGLPKLNNSGVAKEQPAIKIRYVASTEDPDGTRLNEVLEKLREVDAGELLADLRDAKDNIFKRN